MKFGKTLLAAGLLGAIGAAGGLAFSDPEVRAFVTTRRHCRSTDLYGETVVGYAHVLRWDSDHSEGPFCYWFANSGRVARAGRVGKDLGWTDWSTDGRVTRQFRYDRPGGFVLRGEPFPFNGPGGFKASEFGPPWLWEVQDQEEPSAPWILEGVDAMEWLRRNSDS